MKPLSVYIHIPFCVQKCRYCDFLSAPATKEERKAYLSALKKEIVEEAGNYKNYEIETIFWGGGTPSILEAEELAGIMNTLRSHYHLAQNMEITLEMNPGTATPGKLRAIKNMGINRLSIGLQSAQNEELQMLGRIHTYEEFLTTYQEARNAGFTNINIDLMSALPGQGYQEWEDTLRKVAQLGPEHISAYSLIVEEGTQLYRNLEKYPPLPSEEEDRQMYQRTKEILEEYDYERYEISNYARKGYACRHNIVYWVRGDYAGFGLGAASMVNNCRWRNEEDLKRYENTDAGSRKKDFGQLERKECMEEFMYLGLRMTQGVSKQKFYDTFQTSLEEVYGEVLERLSEQGLLVQTPEWVRLTEFGLDVSNIAMSAFL